MARKLTPEEAQVFDNAVAAAQIFSAQMLQPALADFEDQAGSASEAMREFSLWVKDSGPGSTGSG